MTIKSLLRVFVTRAFVESDILDLMLDESSLCSIALLKKLIDNDNEYNVLRKILNNFHDCSRLRILPPLFHTSCSLFWSSEEQRSMERKREYCISSFQIGKSLSVLMWVSISRREMQKHGSIFYFVRTRLRFVPLAEASDIMILFGVVISLV